MDLLKVLSQQGDVHHYFYFGVKHGSAVCNRLQAPVCAACTLVRLVRGRGTIFLAEFSFLVAEFVLLTSDVLLGGIIAICSM